MLELYRNTEDQESKELIRRPDLEIPFVKPELSIEECRKILSSEGEKYTDEEIIEIRTLILNLVEIDYKMYQKRKAESKREAKLIHLQQEDINYKKAA